MRISRIILAFFLFVVLLGISAFIFRHSLVIKLSERYLSPYQTELTCLEINFSHKLNLTIDKACLTTPELAVEVHNASLTWTLLPTISIDNLNVERLSIEGLKPLLVKNNEPETKKDLDVELSQLKEKLGLLDVPTIVDVEQIKYIPFHNTKATDSVIENVYYGHLALAKRQLKFSLAENNHQTNRLSVNLSLNDEAITSTFNVDLAFLQKLLQQHQLIPKIYSNEQFQLIGKIISEFTWQGEELIAQYRLQDIKLMGDEGAISVLLHRNLSAYKQDFALSGSVAGQVKYSAQQLTVENQAQSSLSFSINQKLLAELIKSYSLPSRVNEVVNLNQLQELAVALPEQVNFDFQQKQLAASAFQLYAAIPEQPLKVAADNIVYNINSGTWRSDFSFAGEVKLPKFDAIEYQNLMAKLKGQVSGNKTSSELTLAPVSLILLNQVNTKQQGKTLTLEQVQTGLSGILKYQAGIPIDIDLSIETKLSNIHLEQLAKLTSLTLDTQINGTTEQIDLLGSLNIGTTKLAQLRVEQLLATPKVSINAKDIPLATLLANEVELEQPIKLVDGMLSYQLDGQISSLNQWQTHNFKLALNVENISGTVKESWLEDLNWQQTFLIKDSHITNDKQANNFAIKKLEHGVVINNILATTDISYFEQLDIEVNNMQGELFSGVFNIPHLAWPITTKTLIDLKFSGFDLVQLIALEKQQGIKVTGKISGEIPLAYDGQHFSIEDGSIFNITDGVIQINNNPAVEQFKENNEQLAIAFQALENLHYQQLSSKVSMADNGQMLLETTIKGINPDLDNEVNLNLNLDYDLLGLIESLRIAEDYEQRINQKFHQSKEP